MRFADEEKKNEGPKTKETETWTSAPEYDRFLFIRVFSPIDMKQRDLKCLLKFGDISVKTTRLDPEVVSQFCFQR